MVSSMGFFKKLPRDLAATGTRTGAQKGVSKNLGTPKWMVKIMENPIKTDDLGVPLFLETPISISACAPIF